MRAADRSHLTRASARMGGSEGGGKVIPPRQWRNNAEYEILGWEERRWGRERGTSPKREEVRGELEIW
eukprot:763054-Hanusia_phi.AAC.5